MHDRDSAKQRRRTATFAWIQRIRPVRPFGRATIIPVAVAAMLALAAIVTGAVLLTQSITVDTSAAAPDVIFAAGDDYALINAAGYATLTVGSSGTSASLDLNGIAGAASVLLGDVMKITNADATQAYDVTITRSAAPPAAIDGLTFLVQTAGDATVVSYDAASAGSSGTFSLPASTTYDISVTLVIADGTATGNIGAIDLQFDLVPT